MKSNSQNLQIKLALDDGLKKIWSLLEKEYEALDKASIVRLALNTLAKQSANKDYEKYLDNSIENVINEIESRKTGMTEDEAFEWWNKNKPYTM